LTNYDPGIQYEPTVGLMRDQQLWSPFLDRKSQGRGWTPRKTSFTGHWRKLPTARPLPR